MDECTTCATPEQWLPVPGFEVEYQVSDHGRVWSNPRSIVRSNGWPQTFRARMLTPGITNGYRVYSLVRPGQRWTVCAHRLMLWTFVGPCPSARHEACHNDGDPEHNHLGNLRVGYAREQRP